MPMSRRLAKPAPSLELGPAAMLINALPETVGVAGVKGGGAALGVATADFAVPHIPHSLKEFNDARV